jgi:hypothetical protein
VVVTTGSINVSEPQQQQQQQEVAKELLGAGQCGLESGCWKQQKLVAAVQQEQQQAEPGVAI